MPKCYICNYYDPKRMSLYRIPNRNDEYSERARLWLKLLGEDARNMHNIRICSNHFLKKKPAKSGDYLDLDWVPNKDLGKFSKNWKLIEYHFRKRNKTFPVADHERSPATATIVPKTEEEITLKTNLRESSIHKEVNNSDLTTETGFSFKGAGSGFNGAGSGFNGAGPGLQGSTECVVHSGSKPQEIQNFGSQIKTVGPAALYTVLKPVKEKIKINKMQNFVPRGIQTDFTGSDIDLIFKHYQESLEERKELVAKIATMVIDFDYFRENNKKTRFYTGLPTWKLLSKFFDMIKEFLPNHFNCKLSRFQMIALTLMKLRLNLSFTDLGYRFRIDETTASRYFYRCIFIFYKLFKNSKLIHWPDKRENMLLNIPSYFKSTFKEKITIIVDCFENFIEKSSVLKAAAQGFSFYKHHETLKYLIGISITGAILFVSIGFGGRASDKEVVRLSGFLDKILEGDVVLGDKGFLIQDEIEALNASLKRPSFVKKGSQLHPTEVEQSRDYARIRIHVERVICILRGKFNICSDVVQLSTVAKQNDLFDRDLYDQIIFICSCLVNICPSVVTNCFEM